MNDREQFLRVIGLPFVYLAQQNVRDLGLPAFLNHLIPLVEFAIELPVDRGQGGLVTAR